MNRPSWVIEELIQDVDKEQVAGISFGGQMHGLVILDRDDQVIRPAILWNDGRTGEETAYLNTTIGKEKLSEYTANIAFAGFTAPKLLWVRKHEPENFARIAKSCYPRTTWPTGSQVYSARTCLTLRGCFCLT